MGLPVTQGIKMKKLITALMLLPATYAMANDAEEKPVSLDIEFGLLAISGNTESSALKGKVDLKHDMARFRNKYLIVGLYKEDTIILNDGETTVKDDQITAKKYFASAQTDYKLNEEHRGLFLYGSYEYDKFSGYEYQATIAAGYSDRLFKTDASSLEYSIGPGVAFTETVDSLDADNNLIKGVSDDAPIVRLYAFYEYNFSENATFSQLLSSDVAMESDKNTKSKSVTAITSQLSQSFALKASYTITHNTEVLEGLENADANLGVTLVYSL